ncbi:MAG: hypothetical protein K5853_03005, partial [Lachnospiraceae bacterium]|nr:hypothetical protein [Lachnospiraceae bacterium]
MNWIKRHMFRISFRSFIILALGVMMDIAFRYYATSHNFPIWFDSVGTIYVAAALGPFGGALTGILMSLALGIVDVSAVLYMFVSVAVGVTAGLTYPKQDREKRPELYSIGIVGLYTALVAVLLSTPLNLFYYNGYTGNAWGDAMVDQLALTLNSRIPCALVGEGFVDFPDKVLSVFLTAILIGITEIIDAKFSEKKDRKQITSILLFISVGAFAAASLITPLPVYAEEENKAPDYLSEYASTYYGMDDGLASIEINCITQTGDGYIWVGGYSGLYVFDGTRFYQMDLGKGISSVTTLFTASNGDLWIGTNDVGVVRYSVKAKTSKVYGAAAGLPSESVRSICEDAEGNIYVGTVVSPCVITASGVVGKYEDLAGVSNITSMSAYENWVCGTTGGGALFLMNSDGLCQIIDDGRLYRSLCWGRDGELLAGTTEDELVHFSLQEDHLTERSVSEYPQHAYYNDIYHSPEENGYLVCADDGMAYIDSAGKMTDLTTMSFNNSIKGAMKDYQGNLWFVSDKQGILRYSPNIFKNLGKVSGLPDRVANAVLLDGTDLYVGMDEGLFVIDTTTDTLKDTGYLSALSKARVRGLMKDSKGNIWVSVYGDEGLVEILPSGEMVFFNATNTSMPDSRMRSAIELLNGDIMAAGAFGIVCIRDGRVAYVLTEKDGLETPQILSLMQRPDGAVLAGSDGGGIYVIRDGVVTDNINAGSGLKSPVVLRIVHGKFGYIYVTSNALYYDNGEDVEPLDQFPYSNNYDIHIDDEGIAWVLSSAGIYLVDEIKLISNEEYDYALLNYTRGLDTSLTSNSWNAADERGMYLCCSDGVRYIDMKEYGRFEDDFVIDIHSFMGNGETITEQNSTYYVPAGVTKVEFCPAVLNYSMTNPLVHVYLEGMEDVDYTMKQNEMKEITLNRLPHGTYPLHVQILDEVDHSRVLKEAVFTVEKEAQLYEELYFKIYQYSVLLVFIIYMAWIVARMRNLSVINRQYDQIREAKDEAEMANKAKSRFLAQMSHEIRTPINAVLGMDEMILRESTEKEVLGYAADIYTAGQTLLALINDILDSSKIESGKMEILPVEYEVTSLIHDLYNMIAQRAEDKELRLIVDVDPHIPSLLYGDDVRVRQVITNILTNAIKYTPSGNVWFRVSGVRKSKEIFILHAEV